MDSSGASMITQSSSISMLSSGGPLPRRNSKRLPVTTLAASDRMSLNDAAKLEMSAMPTKTPVSVLQELMSKRGITPKYELLQIEGPIHEPIFRYRVFLSSEFVATGTGRSKKEAKHAAAKNLLDLLVGKQSPEQANASNGTPAVAADSTNQVVSPFDDKVMGNPIGWLQEMCMSRRWPPPFYDMEHEEGLPHERQFTIACHVLKFREVGNGKSKKLAKRMAAHKMWQALQDLPADESAAGEVADDAELSSRPIDYQARYAGLKDSKISTLNTSPNANKFYQFYKYMKVNGPKSAELKAIPLNGKDVDFMELLRQVASEQNFEVTIVEIDEKSLNGKWQCLLQLSTMPVAVVHGLGKNSKEAQDVAARNALEYLKYLTRK